MMDAPWNTNFCDSPRSAFLLSTSSFNKRIKFSNSFFFSLRRL